MKPGTRVRSLVTALALGDEVGEVMDPNRNGTTRWDSWPIWVAFGCGRVIGFKPHELVEVEPQ